MYNLIVATENQKILFVTDETAGITARRGLVVVGASLINWRNEELTNRTGEGVIEHLRANSGKFITTAASGPAVFENIFRSNLPEYEGGIVTVIVDKHLSRFMESAEEARITMGGESEKIHLIGGLPGYGLMRLIGEAEKMAAQGKSAEQIAVALRHAGELITAYLIVENPIYLIQSGRAALIGQFFSAIGRMPVVKVDVGGTHLDGFFRKTNNTNLNTQNSVTAICERITEKDRDRIAHVEVVHTGGVGEERANLLREKLNMGGRVEVSHAGSFISAHIGPDSVGAYVDQIQI